MKNIKYIILSLSFLIMTSCGDDDYSRAYVDEEAKTEVVGTISLDRTSAAPTTQVGFTFTLPQSFETGATIEVRGKSFNLGETVAFVTLPAGQTSGSGSIAMPGESGDATDFDGIADYATIKLTGIALDAGANDPFVLTSDAVSVKSLNYNADYMAPRSDAMKILFDWKNPGANDLDMYVYDWNFDQFESAASGSRYEGDWFNAFHPDGDYFVAIDFWTVEGGDLPYNFHFTHPDGSVDFYEGVFESSENLGFEYPIILITKTTDGAGVSTYTTSLPD